MLFTDVGDRDWCVLLSGDLFDLGLKGTLFCELIPLLGAHFCGLLFGKSLRCV